VGAGAAPTHGGGLSGGERHVRRHSPLHRRGASIAGLTLLSAVVATQNYLVFEAQRDLRPGALAPPISWARLFVLELPV
jgi:hypothetical protein